MKKKNSIPLIIAVCFGNLLEYYDIALYTLLVPFLKPIIFPSSDPLTGMILMYAILPLGKIARPIGSLIFGYIGDKIGRKKAISFSLLGMAVATAMMGLLPTYDQVGLLAPILLGLIRFSQNFFGSGEAGGAVFLMERSDSRWHNILSSVYDCSTMAGIMCASGAISLLTIFWTVEEGWRYLYLVGCSTALVGWFVRIKSDNEEHPVEVVHESFQVVLRRLWAYRGITLSIIMASGFSFVCYSIAFIMMNGIVPLVTTLSNEDAINLNTILLGIDFCMVPLFALLATRFTSEKMMVTACLFCLVTCIPLLSLLPGAGLVTVIAVRLGIIVTGVAFSCTVYAWANRLAPAGIRQSLIGISYALGYSVIGSTSTPLSMYLYKLTGDISSLGWYWMITAAAAGLAVAYQAGFLTRNVESKAETI